MKKLIAKVLAFTVPGFAAAGIAAENSEADEIAA